MPIGIVVVLLQTYVVTRKYWPKVDMLAVLLIWFGEDAEGGGRSSKVPCKLRTERRRDGGPGGDSDRGLLGIVTENKKSKFRPTTTRTLKFWC